MGVLSRAFGNVQWTPPPWAQQLSTAQRWALLAGPLLLGALAMGLWHYLQSRPVPPQVVATATAPALSPVVDDVPQPQPLMIDFHVETDPRQGLEITQAIARMDLLNTPLQSGVTLSPGLEGDWRWVSDTQLVFTPARDWPAGQDYRVSFTRDVFAPGLAFARMDTTFTTPRFTAQIEDFRFYQDPVKRDERKLVATIEFSHPVDPSALRRALSLMSREDGQTIRDTATPMAFDVTQDPARRTAFVHSKTLEIPPRETFAHLQIDAALRSVDSTTALEDAVVETARIPSIASYFKVSAQKFLLPRDEQGDPQQTVTLSFTDRVGTAALKRKLSVYRLPRRLRVNDQWVEKNYWESPREVTPDILSQSRLVEVTLNPHDTPSAALHSLRLDVPTGAHYYLRIEQGLTSDGGFVFSTPYDSIFYAQPYPEEVRIAQEGAILPLSGSHKVHFVSRGVKALKVEIGRLLDRDVNHLASQIDGDIKDARFSHWRFNQDNLSEREEQIIALPSADPKRASFAHLDLSPFLSKGGYYYVQVSGWNPEGQYVTGTSDRRIVMITDLGLMAKVAADGQQDLFVHSLRGGTPVAGATVELLGKNGVAVMSATTDADGHARLPSAQALQREKTPTVYVVRRGSDSVFMPYGRYTRQLDVSRFDTGGEYGGTDGDELRAQLFTERDLFRPGDRVHLAAIIKRNNWRPLDRLPLRLEVRNSRGQLIVDKPMRIPADGFIEHTLQTDPASPTGIYEVALYTVEQRHRRRYLGGHQFKVEEFQPDRLRIRSTLGDQPAKGWMMPGDLVVQVQLDNLFGTPAAERRVQGSLRLRPARITFADYADYVFIDPLRRKGVTPQTLERTLTPTTTDNDGAATLPLGLEQYDGGIYELTVYTEGFEADGGRSVKSMARVMLSPLDYLVGYKANGSLDFIAREATQAIEFIAVNQRAENVALDGLSLQLLEQRFVSSLVKQQDGTFAYQSISQDVPILETPFAVAAEGSRYVLPTSSAGRFVVQLLDADQRVVSRVPFVVAGAANVAGNLEQDAELDVILDKTSYAPGESLQVQVTAPYSGTGLITIERDRVLAHRWFRTTTNASTQSIQLPADLEGNAYVNVSFMRSLDAQEVYLNPLSYAVVPFSIKRDARTLRVSLDAPTTVEPGETLHIDYRTSRPGRLVVFAVDEGILQVANYQPPKPLDFFLRKRALRVSTYQLADLVLPEFVRPSQRAAPGGGEAASLAGRNLNPFRRRSEAPVVYWSGLIDSDTRGGTLSYAVPDYFNGSLRVMAVAVTDDAVGDATQSVEVKGPFVITPSVPTSVSPGDEFDLGVGVANNIDTPGNAPVQVTLTTSAHLEVVGASTQNLSIGAGRETSTRFRLRATDSVGSATLTLAASTSTHALRRQATLSVRPATPYLTTLKAAVHDRDPAEVEAHRSLRPELASTHISASTDPVVLAEGLQRYLDGFPHACAEQMVSKVFPMVGLFGRSAAIDDSAIRAQFDRLIQKLRSRQLPNGGFRFWLTSREAAEFPSVYIAHFLTEARDVDLPVPQAMQQRALAYVRELAARTARTADEARLRAYAIYVLTRNSEVTTNYLTSLQEYLESGSDEWRRDLTGAYMAASYALLKLDDLGDELIASYALKGGSEQYSDFDSRLGRDAQYLMLLARHFPERLDQTNAEQLLRIVSPMFENRFNTLSSAYTILALQAFGTAKAESALPLTLVDASGQALSEASAIARAGLDTAIRRVQIRGGQNRTVFSALSQTGYDQTVPTTPLSEGLELDRRFFNAQGAEVRDAALGDELEVRLRVRSTGPARSNVAVVDLLPGGFEVLTDSVRDQHGRWRVDFMDVREDRVVTYGTFGDRTTEIRYRVKATAAGAFTVPAAYASSMYDLGVRAHTAGARFTVTPPGVAQ